MKTDMENKLLAALEAVQEFLIEPQQECVCGSIQAEHGCPECSRHEKIMRTVSHALDIAEVDEQATKSELNALKMEVADLRLQRDALLEMTWLDLPNDPRESTQRWKEEFAKGWERKP